MDPLAHSSSTLTVLLTAAVSIAAGHTVIGIDHSLPFIVLGRARKWSMARLLTITALCGVGHVLSSVLLGFVGIGLGIALERLSWIEAARGSFAAWLLIGFGTLYAVRAWIRMSRRRPHTHSHHHAHGHAHSHEHDHAAPEHMHPHDAHSQHVLTVWALFIVFAFGPCEPLIPLMMAPAALHNWAWVAIVCSVFGLVTIAVMLAVVSVGYLGLSQVRMDWAERHADLLAGVAIACSGLAIQAFGL